MKKILLISLIAVGCHSNEPKESYLLKSFPTYDELGNYYEMDTTFDHKPTQEDTAAFYKSSDAQLTKLMDSVVKAQTRSTGK